MIALGLIAAMQSKPVHQWLSDRRESVADVAIDQLQFDIASKLAVGVKTLRPEDESAARKLLEDVEGSATSDGLVIRAAIVAGELLGADAAIQRLDDYLQAEANDKNVDIEGLVSEAILLKEWYGYKAEDEAGFDLLVRWSELGRPLDWYVDLASAYGLPEDNPFREKVIGDAIKALLVLGVGVMCVVCGLMIGVVLGIIGLVLYFTGRLKMKFRKRIEKRPVYLGTVSIFLLLIISLSLGVRLFAKMIPDEIMIEYQSGIGWTLKLILYAGVPMALLWPRIRGTKCGVMKRDVGWYCGDGGFVGFVKEVIAGIAGYLAGLPLVLFSIVLATLLSKVTGEEGGHPIVFELSQGSIWLILFAVITASVWAPLVEESVFRGVFFAHLRRRWGFWWSALVVAFVFAAIHPQSLVGLPPIMALSIVFSLVREWRGSLVGPMVAHGLHNGVVTVFVLMMMR